MNRTQRWLFHLANLLVTASGLMYAWMLYLLEPADEYALVNHPWQGDVQHAHVLLAPALVWMGGVFWVTHAGPSWRGRRPARRRSGVALIALLAPMIVSGYAIQVAQGESWRDAWIVVHVASSGCWILASLVHLVTNRVRRAHPMVEGAASSVTRG